MTTEEITAIIKKSGLNWIVPLAIVAGVSVYIYKNYKELQILKQQFVLNKYAIAEYEQKSKI
jgi:hypothetical protein